MTLPAVGSHDSYSSTAKAWLLQCMESSYSLFLCPNNSVYSDSTADHLLCGNYSAAISREVFNVHILGVKQLPLTS